MRFYRVAFGRWIENSVNKELTPVVSRSSGLELLPFEDGLEGVELCSTDFFRSRSRDVITSAPEPRLVSSELPLLSLSLALRRELSHHH